MYLHIFLQYNARVAGRGSAMFEENDLTFTFLRFAGAYSS